jgi:hypothetical protein
MRFAEEKANEVFRVGDAQLMRRRVGHAQKLHTCAADPVAQFDFHIPPAQPSRIGCTRVALGMSGSQRR